MSEQRQNTFNDLQILVFTFLLLFLLTIHIIARTQSVSTSGAAFHIVQSDGETPIAEVLVRVCLRGKVIYQTSSDSKGLFILPSLEVPDLTLEFTKSGFISERLVGQKVANISDPIRLFQEGVFEGKVLTVKAGKPVAGARINLWGPNGQVQTSTDRDGRFYINQLKTGKYTVTLQADGFAVQSVEEMEIHGGQTIEKDFRLQDGSLFTGKIIDKETNQPLKNIYIYLSGNHYYYDYTDDQGFFSFANLEPGTYELRVYHEGFKPLESASVTIGEGSNNLGTVYYLQPLDPQFEIYTYQQVFTPGQKVDIHVRSYRISELQCAIYRIPPQELKQHKSAWMHRPAELLTKKVPFSKWVKQMEIKDITRWQTRSISFPLSRNGFYLLQIQSKTKTKFVPIFYTDLGLIVKSIPNNTLVWSHRLTDSLPLSSVSIESEYPNSNSSTIRGVTDSQGLLRFQEGSAQNYNLWAFRGADAAYAEIYEGYNQNNTLKAYIYTDRPVYRPGHTVQYKGILRQERGDVYQMLADHEFDLRIRDATGAIIFQQQHLRTSSHGSFSGQFKLADEPSLGTYQIEVVSGISQFGQFKVLEYRKPEFEIKVFPDKTRYLNGDTIEAKISATYYFGAPVANQKVDYSVLDSAYYSWDYEDWDDSYSGEFESEYDYYGYGRVITSGSVQLNENGEATLSIPAGKENYDRYFNIEARISDQSRREVTGRSRVLVTRGEYKLGLFADSWVYTAGDKVTLRVKASDFDDVPASVKVQIHGSFAHWNKKSYRYDYTRQWTQEVQTDKNGSAQISFSTSRSGYLQLEAVAEDIRGNRINDSRYIWISGQDEEYVDWYNQRGLQLIPDKKKKNPGEEAKLLIQSPVQNVHALVTFEGSSLHKAEVVKLQGSTKLITFTALAQYAPSLYVSVCFSQRKQFYSRTIVFDISTSNQFLKVDIRADKAKYKPRETAKYSIHIRDASGHPVSTEFSFGLVDESIYAVSPELVPDIQKFFYGPRPNRVFTYYSFPPRYLGGADKDANKQIRKDFPDTAYWNASVRTDSNGMALIEVPLPDSLTTWRATVRAATDETEVGSAIQKIVTAKNLIARLETPRFFTVGDTLLVTGVLHNLSEKPLEIKAKLTTDQALQLEESPEKKLRLASQQIRRVDWKLQALKPGSTRIVLAADAAAEFDGMQLDVPVLPFGIQRFVAFSGQSDTSTTRNFTLPEKSDLPTAHLQLYFTPSIAGLAFDSLEYLTGYPYGCVEQTMSRFLPDIVVEQALQQSNIRNEQLSSELPKQINAGLQRLYHFQHEDGGWGWWENDETDPYMTAYVIYGLSLAKQAGYAVDDNRLTQATAALKLLLEKEQQQNTRAYMLFALSHSNEKEFVKAKVQEMSLHLDQLNPYSLAALSLAAQNAGDSDQARKILDQLATKAVVTDAHAFWMASAFSHGWTDNQVETAAYPLQAFLRLDPKNPLVPKIVRWLVDQRQGNRWQSTKDTAASIIALMEYLRSSDELKAHYFAKIFVNDTQVGDMRVEPQNAWSVRKHFDLYTPALRAGENRLRIEMAGNGLVYFSGELRYFESGNTAKPENKGITVTRQYFRYKRTVDRNNFADSTTEVLQGKIKVGEEILVKLNIQASHDFEYVILEDPLPSGFEVVTDPADYYEWNYWYCRREVRDEKVAFFTTWLDEGQREIYYIIRAEVPSDLRVSPAQSWAMYVPEIRGNSSGNFLTVAD